MRPIFARDDRITDNQEGKVDRDYLAEVEQMTARRAALHSRRAASAARLAEAERRVDELKASRASRVVIREAWKLVHAREEELRVLEWLMHSAPGASAAHRGVKSTHRDDTARIPDEPKERTSDGRVHPVTTHREV